MIYFLKSICHFKVRYRQTLLLAGLSITFHRMFYNITFYRSICIFFLQLKDFKLKKTTCILVPCHIFWSLVVDTYLFYLGCIFNTFLNPLPLFPACLTPLSFFEKTQKMSNQKGKKKKSAAVPFVPPCPHKKLIFSGWLKV